MVHRHRVGTIRIPESAETGRAASLKQADQMSSYSEDLVEERADVEALGFFDTET
jgi:hypothetical protein